MNKSLTNCELPERHQTSLTNWIPAPPYQSYNCSWIIASQLSCWNKKLYSLVVTGQHGMRLSLNITLIMCDRTLGPIIKHAYYTYFTVKNTIRIIRTVASWRSSAHQYMIHFKTDLRDPSWHWHLTFIAQNGVASCAWISNWSTFELTNGLQVHTALQHVNLVILLLTFQRNKFSTNDVNICY